MRIGKNYKQVGTHIPMLLNVLPKTTGDVAELGAGFSSTPILHWLCQGRRLVTYESDPEWLWFAKKFQTNTHRIRPFTEVDFEKHWSVVFVDHSTKINGKMPENGWQRGDDILKFKDVDVFILHDTEQEENYHYDIVFPKFKYRLDWTETRPHTSAISNTIDVTKWQN